jgi:alpha-beta hydrolase superfamily lysophospholipase
VQNEAMIMVRGKRLLLLLAGMLLAACAGGHASPGRPSGGAAAPAAAPERPPDNFYAVPDPLPAGRPGALIRVAAIAGSPQLAGSRAWAILYHSRSLDGHDVAVSGTVVAPPGAAPAGGRPVLAWGHGSSGLADQCAPSHHGVIGVFGPAGSRWLGELLERGLVVAATDYQGLGTPGLARFSIGLAAGDAVLDAARAARQLPGAGASSRVVLVGHSEGGHAVLWAAELAGSYAPELQVVGVAAIAPAADLPALVRLAGARPATVTSGAMLLVVAWSDAYHLPLSVLLPAGRMAAARVRSSCLEELAAGPSPAAVRPSDLLKVAPWPALLERNTPGHTATQVPLLIAQGTNDERVAPASNRSMAARLCRAGDKVQLRTYPNVDHMGIIDAAADDVLAWIGDRLAGQPDRPANPEGPHPRIESTTWARKAAWTTTGQGTS